MPIKYIKRNFTWMGDFNRSSPFCDEFGYTRGGPIDRYYIELFIENYSHLIKGKVLEIGDDGYTKKYGGKKVFQSDVLHVNSSNPQATIIGDLCNLPQIESEEFDCIILTQTLHLIFNYCDALKTCYRILKKNGTLLITVPGITPIDKGEWKDSWFWSFTPSSLTIILDDIFGSKWHKDKSFGNLKTAIAFLYGMGKPEMSNEDLDTFDPFYPVVLTSCCVKS